MVASTQNIVDLGISLTFFPKRIKINSKQAKVIRIIKIIGVILYLNEVRISPCNKATTDLVLPQPGQYNPDIFLKKHSGKKFFRQIKKSLNKNRIKIIKNGNNINKHFVLLLLFFNILVIFINKKSFHYYQIYYNYIM